MSRDNPLGYLWVRDLLEAVDAGAISREFVDEHVRLGYVRPSLLYQLDHRVEETALLPKAARRLDDAFVPPYRKMGAHGASRTESRRPRARDPAACLSEESAVPDREEAAGTGGLAAS